jgi:class 3 adenylate cyclase
LVDATAGSAPLPQGERRQAAVLFADIAGYTALCASLDAEHVQGLLGRFYEFVDGIIVNYGGYVVDHSGDAVLACFGAPLAHDNDGERALRAALEMHAGAPGLIYAGSKSLQLHIGIANGEVVAAVIAGGAQPKYAITGETVNLAARLCAHAQAGQILASESAYQSVSRVADAQLLGGMSFKGFADPVPVWNVTALLQAAGNRHVFVGRQAEMRQLVSVAESTMESGIGAAVCVRGEPGIGKSRLVRELCDNAGRRGLACLVGHVLDFGVAKGKGALPTILKDVLRVPASAAEGARAECIKRALEEGIVATEHEVFVNDLLDVRQPPALQFVFDAMDNVTRTRRTGEAIAQTISRACARQPRLLVIEDIHWASPALLSHLAQLTIATTTCPLVLVTTSRVEGDPLDRIWRASTHGRPLMTIDLGPLRQEDAQLLASELIEISSRVAQHCVERAEGNPLFLEQLLRSARESELSNVPASVQSLVLARMDRLSARDKAALQAASVIGKRFMSDALAHLIDDPGYRGDALFSADLIRPERDELVFAHALIQEGVYSSLLSARRRELHRKAAQWYATRDSGLHAEHLDRAEDPAAAAAYLAAANDQANHHRNESALRFARRGSELAAGRDVAARLLLLQGELLLELGRSPEAATAFRAALDAPTEPTERCDAWMGVAAADRVMGDVTAAMHALDQAEPIAVDLGLDIARSRIHYTRGNLYFAQGNADACTTQHNMALDLARQSGDAECEARALSGLGDAQYVPGRMLTALGYFRQCVAICDREGLIGVEIPNRCMVGHCTWYTNRIDDAIAEGQAARASAQAVGSSQAELFAQESLSLFLAEAGRYDEAEEACEKALALARPAHARRYESAVLYVQATIRNAGGDRGAAHELLMRALDLSRQSGPAFLAAAVFGKLGLLARDAIERKQALAQGEALLQQNCIGHCRVYFCRDAIEASLAANEWNQALHYAGIMEEFTRPEPLPWTDLLIARARALVALGTDGADTNSTVQLRKIRGEIERAGFVPALAAIDAALSR